MLGERTGGKNIMAMNQEETGAEHQPIAIVTLQYTIKNIFLSMCVLCSVTEMSHQ
jgi:hypothetical protein